MTYQVNDKLYFVRDMQKGDVVVSGIVVDVGVPKDNKIDYIMQFPEDADPDTTNQLYALTEAEYLEYYKRQPEAAATNKKKGNKHMNNEINALMEQMNKLQETIKALQDNNNNFSDNQVPDSPPMMTVNTSNNNIPPQVQASREAARQWRIKNHEYRKEYERLRDQRDKINSQMMKLRKQYGIMERARPIRRTS
jgi:cell division protein FtsB